jgi:hypothetical protein
MTDKMNIEQRLQRAAASLAEMPSVCETVMSRLDQLAVQPARANVAVRQSGAEWRWRLPAVAAAAAAITALWLVLPGGDVGQSAWWLAAPAAVAQEVRATVDAALLGGATAEEQTIVIGADGNRHTSSTTSRLYASAGRAYRRDIYDDGKLREIHWYFQEDDALVQTSVRYDSQTVDVCRHPLTVNETNIAENLRRLSGHIAQADLRLDYREIEKHKCVGFEIDNRKLDPAASAGVLRVWLDVDTKLPVRIEFETSQPNEAQPKALILVTGHFNWRPDLPADTYTPKVPADFRLVGQR